MFFGSLNIVRSVPDPPKAVHFWWIQHMCRGIFGGSEKHSSKDQTSNYMENEMFYPDAQRENG